MRKLINAGLMIVGVGIALLPAAQLTAQPAKARPDFSGIWVYDPEATQSAATATHMANNIFGESFVVHQDATSITLDITIAQGVAPVKAVYALDGKATKNVSPPQTPGAAPIVVTATARWEDDVLVIDSKSEQPGGRGAAAISVLSTRRIWLAGNGRLVIDREGTPKTVVPSTRSVYVRNVKK